MTELPQEDEIATALPDSADPYATWDGPYVLGALARAERLEYEEHLVRCPDCRAAIADLAGLPGLLGRVDPDVAIALIDPIGVPPGATNGHDTGSGVVRELPANGNSSATTESEKSAESSEDTEVPPSVLPRLAERGRRKQRRGRWLAFGGAVAAAAAAVAIAVPVTAAVSTRPPPAPAPPGPQVVAERSMDAIRPSPITADFRLVAVPDGTRIEMTCSYAPSDTDYTWSGTLWVVRADGTQSLIAQWTAHPGQTLSADGSTAVPPAQVKAVEIRSAADNQVLLSGSL